MNSRRAAAKPAAAEGVLAPMSDDSTGAAGAAAACEAAPAVLPQKLLQHKAGAPDMQQAEQAEQQQAEQQQAQAEGPSHQKQRSNMHRVGSVGLVSNESLQEEELEQFFAPEDALAEEERLRREREEKEAAEEAADAPPKARAQHGCRARSRWCLDRCGVSAASAVARTLCPGRPGQPPLPLRTLGTLDAGPELESNKFAQLEALLERSKAYTQFLTEQMEDVGDKTFAEAAQARRLGREMRLGSGWELAADKGKAAKGKGRGGRAKAGAKRKAGEDEAEAGVAAKKAREDIAAVTNELCPGFTGSLRDYQLKGVRWMISLYNNGLNGILADQMGLGKTVQTIAFLCHLRGKGRINGPYLILGPLSTLSNWKSEFERWAPDFPALLYHGSKQERADLRASHLPVHCKGTVDDKFPVIITSYEIAIADIKLLQRHQYKYVIVDEGHRLKNFNCKLIRELRTLSAQNKLLLTGTPLQNNLKELWSLLNFLLPDVFSSLDMFESWFDFSEKLGQEGGDREILAQEQRGRVVSKLHQILKPFLLRRVKTDMEVTLYAPMSDKQKEINQQLRDKTLAEVVGKLSKGASAGAASLNNMRKNCNHPDLITGPYDGSTVYPPPEELIADCGKASAACLRLPGCIRLHQAACARAECGCDARGLYVRAPAWARAGARSSGAWAPAPPLGPACARQHTLLLRSFPTLLLLPHPAAPPPLQMTSMLDIMEAYLEAKEIECCRIDGSIPWQERQESMRRFNTEPECKVFLLSTRAGGLGINLTAADTCIIYDSDWNPHQDLQAMDRCHRIGQQKPVLVLRLATAHSVEGKMLRRAGSKLALERLVIKKGAFKDVHENKSATSLGADELLDLLKADVSLDDVPQSGQVDDEGVGYEVVQQLDASGLLKGVDPLRAPSRLHCTPAPLEYAACVVCNACNSSPFPPDFQRADMGVVGAKTLGNVSAIIAVRGALPAPVTGEFGPSYDAQAKSTPRR
eukprot:scaffold19.g1799.t1